MAEEFNILFVNATGNGENNSSLFEAYEKLRNSKYDFRPEWISPEDCLKVVNKGKHIYIFDPFEGPAFCHIRDLGYRIYGPQCILANLIHNEELPQSKKYPIYNLAMKGCVICCTSIESSVRDDVGKKVRLMGGDIERNLTKIVTHLVAGEVGSSKYLAAMDNNKEVMTKQWIYAVWEASQDKYIVAKDKSFEKYKCPIFKGLTVVVSGFSTSERNQMKSFVVRGGGTYSGEMKMNECTHLVVKEPKGAKFEAAKSWKIKIVKDRWLYDSMDKGRFLDPSRYQFDTVTTKTSTPERQSMAAPQISNISAISYALNTSGQTVNDTDLMASRTSDMFSFAGHNPEVGETKLDSTTVQMNAVGTTDSIDIFLDGCKIFLSGVKQVLDEKLKKIITAGGGTRSKSLDDSVTHVIVGDIVASDMITLNGMKKCPYVVKADWLMDCFHCKIHLPEGKYLCHDLGLKVSKMGDKSGEAPVNPWKEDTLQTSATSNNDKTLVDNKNGDPVCTQEAAFGCGKEALSDMEMAELLSQYIVPQDEEKASDCPDSEVQFMGEEKLQRLDEKDPKEEEESSEMTQNPNDITEDNGDDQGIFSKKTFIFLGFDEEEANELTKFTEEKGGRVITQNPRRKVIDFAIVPLLGFSVDVTVTEVLTNAWLQMCVAMDELLPYDELWFSRPMILPDAEPLSGCSICVSGYVGTERDIIIHLGQILGALVQENFSNKNTKKVKASTHLIVNKPEGQKYNASKRWNIPAVGRQWLTDCAASASCLPVNDYLIEVLERNLAQEQSEKTVKKSSAVTESGSSLQDQQNAAWLSHSKNKTSSESGLDNESSSKTNNSKGSVNLVSEDVDVRKDHPSGLEDPFASEWDVAEQGASKVVEIEPRVEEAIPTSSTESQESSSKNKQEQNPMAQFRRSMAVATPETPKLKPGFSSTPKGVCQPNQTENITAGNLTTPLDIQRKKWGVSIPNASPNSSSTPLGMIRGGGETPRTFLQPGFRANFNLESVLTPDAAQSDLDKSTPLGELFRRQITKAAQNTANLIDKDLAPSQSQAEELPPLHGVVIAVAKKLGRSHNEYNELVVELGGSYSWDFNDQVTHFVFQGRVNDTNKEFRKARDEQKIIVSPHWLYMCREQNCRVDETLFPHHFNPNLNLVVGSAKKDSPLRGTRASTRMKGHNETPSKPSYTTSWKTPVRKKPVLDLQSVDAPKAKSDGKAVTCNTADAESNYREQPEVIMKQPDVSSEMSSTLKEAALQDKNDNTTPTTNCIDTSGRTTDLSTDNAGSSVDRDKGTSAERTKNQELKEALSKTLGNALAGASRSKRSQKKKRMNFSGQLSTSDGNTPPNSLAQTRAAGWMIKEAAKDPVPPEPSQSLQVTWDDPTGRLEKEKLAHRLERVCEPSQNTDELLGAMQFPDDNADVNNSFSSRLKHSTKKSSSVPERSPTPEPPSIAFPIPKPVTKVLSPQPVELLSEESSDSRGGISSVKAPIFLISGMQNEERVDYAALVEQLGGKMVEKQNFDPICTHLVVGQPTRNEKYLSSVAAGKWVLHKSYLEACRKEGHFVAEEDHEWGSENTHLLMQNMTVQAKKLAAAARKWRRKICDVKKSNPAYKGAFDGWRVYLCLDRSKEENFKRILEAGGAMVSSIRSPFPDSLKGTHAFIDLRKVKLEQVDLEKLIEANIDCLKPEYIVSFMTDNVLPDSSDFCPAEVVALKACMPDTNRSRKRRLGDQGMSTDAKAARI